jgi:hypothetical protein
MMTEDISEFIRDKDIEYTFYGKDGEVLSEEVAHACAYILSGDESEFYYVKVYRSELFDPEGIDANKISSVHTKFSKVSKEIFDFYLNYLTNKERNQFTWAKRGMVNV